MPKPVKILAAASPYLEALNQPTSDEAAAMVSELVDTVASIDGDRVVDAFEAAELKACYDQVLPNGGPVTTQAAQDIMSVLQARMGDIIAARPKSTEVLFTSEGKALDRFRDAIVGSMEDVIIKAAGRPVDVNMMVFSFTDKVMSDRILELAEQNPNVTFRLLTDWSQLATSGNRQPRRLERLARDRGLSNVLVRWKKDAPYSWSERAGRPVYHHGSVKGLNHHKGFAALIDGRPEKMVMGSFNWSVGAMESNYENLMVLDRADSDNRPVLNNYQSEFEAFWNNTDVALTVNQALNYKDELFAELHAANGKEYTSRSYDYQGVNDEQEYAVENTSAFFDLNSLADEDVSLLQDLLGKTRTAKIVREIRDYGRIDSYTELLARVPKVATASTWALAQLRERLEYGDGGLSVNTASFEELDRAGFTPRQSAAVIAFREEHGPFESLEELDAVRGIGTRTIDKIRIAFTDDHNLGTYSATVPGGATTTGFSPDNHGTVSVPAFGLTSANAALIPVNRADQVDVEKDLASVVKDMMRRAEPGQTFRMAMYGLSTSSPEWAELDTAIRRCGKIGEAGAQPLKIRVVLYKSYNGKAIDALKALQAEGYDVDLKIIKSRVMHEKFGVIGDDCFNGSANMSSSSIKKHAEDRFLFRNMPDLAGRFVEEFSRLWAKGKDA